MTRRDRENRFLRCPKKFKLYHVVLVLVTLFVAVHLLSLHRASAWTAQLNNLKEPQEGPCFTDACIQSHAAKLARVWQRRPRHEWCGNSTRSTSTTTLAQTASSKTTTSSANDDTGLVLIKVPKSASSTMAGIVLRINELYQCPVRWQHAKAADVFTTFSQQQRQLTFRLAPVRHPHARTLSSVYYHSVSLVPRRQQDVTPSDAHILRQLQTVENNYIADYTRPNSNTILSPTSVVQDILQAYDFLLVVEELSASLVVWAWLADLPLSDVLPMSSKTTGSWYATGRKSCVSLVPPVVTPAVSAYWKRGPGKSRHYTDRLLHAAAVRSLHLTIEQGMGRALFQQRLQEFQTLQTMVGQVCGAIMNESAPCSPTGVYQPQVAKAACYTRDFGCGHACVNHAVQQVQTSIWGDQREA